MQALAIIALVFASLSIFIPVLGIFLAMLCSIFALITFRSQSVISGVTFGLNIISTAFLSPNIVAAELANEIISSGANATPGTKPSSQNSLTIAS